MTLTPAAIRSLVEKKRGGGEHDAGEIRELVEGFTRGEVDDGPMAAWLMAVCLVGMSLDETAALTKAMAESGDVIDWRGVKGPVVDKHSTGGVGDAVTLVAVPLVAACGVKVAKLSGRALGHTGGTIDKLECIPGMRTELSIDEFVSQVARVGCAVAAASAALAPADKKLYALRDRTGTVASIPLITASVLSKKIAGGAPAIVLDVKVGGGAFMRTLPDAKRLGEIMVDVGRRLGRNVRVLVTDMDVPLADSIGDALELDEALTLLEHPGTSSRLWTVAAAVGAEMLRAGGVAGASTSAEHDRLAAARAAGDGMRTFGAMVAAQGGRLSEFDRSLPQPVTIAATDGGFVESIDALAIGQIVASAKSGRPREQARRTGVRLRKHAGDEVRRSDALMDFFAPASSGDVARELASAVKIGKSAPAVRPLIRCTIGAEMQM